MSCSGSSTPPRSWRAFRWCIFTKKSPRTATFRPNASYYDFRPLLSLSPTMNLRPLSTFWHTWTLLPSLPSRFTRVCLAGRGKACGPSITSRMIVFRGGFGRPYGEDITLRFSIRSSVRPSPRRFSGHHNVLCSTGPTIRTNTLKIAFSKLDTEVEANFQDTPRSVSNRTYGVL